MPLNFLSYDISQLFLCVVNFLIKMVYLNNEDDKQDHDNMCADCITIIQCKR